MAKVAITPAELLAGLRFGDISRGSPDAILASEKAGQDALAEANSWVPKECFGKTPAEARAAIEARGIKIVNEDDDLFFQVELPEGWRIAPTDHSMHSDLLDADGEIVAGIFYKAAFYDRRADIHWKEEDVADARTS